MENVFVVPDIHGKLHILQMMLKKWNPDKQRLIMLGDLIDRGEDSYGVVHLAMQLKEKYGSIVLQGNHENMFLDWLEMPSYNMDYYYSQGGRETIHSFFEKNITFSHMPNDIADLIKEHFPFEIEFLKELPLYYEWENYIFAHAGVNLDLKDWLNTKPSDFYWIREPFHYGRNETGKTIVFGHTPTPILNKDSNNNDVWISPCKTKIGLDGGIAYGGKLHGLLINNEGHTLYSINHDLSYIEERAS